jgi:Fe2+ or Zn2+ uptake regulation protein
MSNVIELGKDIMLNPIKSEYTGCKHTRILVVEHTRLLKCADCGKAIEPFDHMLRYANGQQRIVWNLKHVKIELKEIQDKIADLKKHKINLQAQVNRLKNSIKSR